MRKVLSLLIVFTLLVGIIVPAYADGVIAVSTTSSNNSSSNNSVDEKNVKISKDKAKEIALKFLKDNLSTEIDLKKFNSNLQLANDYEEPAEKIWELSWNNYDGNKSININVAINANDGTVYRVNKHESNRQKTPTVAEITEAKAKEIADGFLKKVNSGIQKELKYQERPYDSIYRSGYNQVNYNFNYVRMVNGIKFENNYINIGVEGNTGKISSYQYRWTKNDKQQFPSIDKVIGNSKADEIFNNNTNLELKYRVIRNKGVVMDASKDWQLVYGINDYTGAIIDANDGSLLRWDGIVIDNKSKKDITKEQKDKIFSEAKNIIPSKTEITEAKAREIMENEIKKQLGADYKINGIRYAENENTWSVANKKMWSADFSKKVDGMAYMGGDISIDATTGRLISFYFYNDGMDDQNFEPKLTIGAAYDRAISLISDNFPDYINSIKTEQLLQEEPYYANGKKIHQRYYNFNFPRIEKGIVIEGNYISIGFDAKTGSVNNIDCTWNDDVKLPKLEGIISKEKAQSIFFSTYKPELQYMSFNKSDENNNVKSETKLIYKLKTEYFIAGIDAKYGKIIDNNGVEIVNGKDSFDETIKGHKAEKELSILASQGIIDKKDFKLDKQLTRMDAVKMLVNARGNIYGRISGEEPLFTDMKKTDEDYAMIQMAVFYGIVDNKEVEFKAAEKLTREELAQLIIKGIGYEKAAKAKGIYVITSKDAKQIDDSKKGYVALCRGMGIMEDIKGNFEPKGYINMADASAAIYKALSNFIQIK